VGCAGSCRGPREQFVPKTAVISVPPHLAKTVNPPFGSKGKWLDNITPAAVSNNFRKGVAVEPGGHSYGHLVPAEGYFKDNPEYFALSNGRRTG